ncbi:MAG: single-stranded-DNA-specific exonuclease RecJ [Armatimonadota bacterium]
MQNKFWNIKSTDKDKTLKLARETGLSYQMSSVLVNRGIEDKESADMFLYHNLENLYDPYSMNGVKDAVNMIKKAVNEGEKIGVFGDYDVDGVTSTVLLCEALNHMGADFKYYLPHRIEEGYGLSSEGIEWAGKNHIKLVITVDNGISNIEEINKLKSLGMKVIVTDHHEVPEKLPPADIIINPKQKDCPYPNKDLSGVGVAFKLVHALFEDKPDIWKEWIYLAALGTLADCMDLSIENRIIVKEGIKQLNENPSAGVRSLLEVSGFKNKKVDTQTITFIMGPRINAAGRLDKAEFACELLLEKDEDKAKTLAVQLNNLNIKRQKTEVQMQKDIEKMLMEDPQMVDQNIIFLFNKNWHLGVLGIVASKLVDKFNKPVFLMALKGSHIKGSARCPENYNLFRMLSSSSDYLLHYGGHKAAAGFSFSEENKDKIFDMLNAEALKYGTFTEKIDIDSEIELSKLTLDFVREFSLLEPFGNKNPEPKFLIRGAHIQDAGLVGRPPVHLRMNIKQGQYLNKVIGFGKEYLYSHIYPDTFFYDFVVTLGIDSYMGVDKVNLICIDMKKPDDFVKSVLRKSMDMHGSLNADKAGSVIDARNLKNKDGYLENIMEHKESLLVLFSSEKQAYTVSKLFNGSSFVNNVAEWDKALGCSKKYIFASYDLAGKIKPDLSILEDVILYGLPEDYTQFPGLLKIISGCGAVHLLFGFDEIAGERRKIEEKFISRQKLEKIYNIIWRINRQNMEFNPRLLEKENIDPLSFDLGLNIFEELGICKITKSASGACFELNAGVKKNLEDSSKYRHIKSEKDRILNIIDSLDEINLIELKEKINGFRNKSEQLSLSQLSLGGVNR